MDREELFQLILRKKWPEVMAIVYRHHREVASDDVSRLAIQTFTDEFFAHVATEALDEDTVAALQYLHFAHTEGKFRVDAARYRSLIINLARSRMGRKDLAGAYDYARHLPDDEYCASVIKQYDDSLPKRVAHSQSHKIRVTENRNVAEADGRRSLFRSKQERDFFGALVEVFHQHIVYPNVAVQSVVDFEKVRDRLSKEERDYFFRAIIDCVVFDHVNALYQPIFFYELDSVYHDDPGRKARDDMKDRILGAAGQSLRRIRAVGAAVGRDEFVTLVREFGLGKKA
ncbi:MAG TPA: DUF2726 domain-containing protein [Pyrinomonadaceae bacterium]|nr:DUF2726 domain-containing protein [Pyrinomonadaceae bacterium]